MFVRAYVCVSNIQLYYRKLCVGTTICPQGQQILIKSYRSRNSPKNLVTTVTPKGKKVCINKTELLSTIV